MNERAVHQACCSTRTVEDLQPDCTFQMSGNTISVQTLKLNQEFSAIADVLDLIAWKHFQQIRAGGEGNGSTTAY